MTSNEEARDRFLAGCAVIAALMVAAAIVILS
jgi:hypothetical protein